MAALSKIGEKGVENLFDFLKSFSDKIFYHATSSNIQKFSDSPPRGATYFTTDAESAMDIVEGSNKKLIPVNITTSKLFDPYNELHTDLLKNKIESEPKSLDNWKALENSKVQSALKDLGFEGYRVRMSATPNEIGIFNPEKYIKRLD